MKAAFIEQYGGPEVLKYGDLPDPVAGPAEVVIDVVAASVNGADWKVRVGQYKQSKLPFALVRDFSGVISAIGEGVADLKVGDAVFGVCDAGQEGAYAEKIAVKAAIVAKKPDGLSHVNAAALALTGLTAMSAIEDTLKLQPVETILIHGGAGGVASFAIQLAKHIGAHIITTASAANHEYVRGLGADEIIDYNGRDFTQIVTNCDDFARIPVCGLIAQYDATTPMPGPDMFSVLRKRLLLRGFIVSDFAAKQGDFLRDVGEWVRTGRIKYREDIVDGLEKAPASFLGVLQGKNFGKILVRMAT